MLALLFMLRLCYVYVTFLQRIDRVFGVKKKQRRWRGRGEELEELDSDMRAFPKRKMLQILHNWIFCSTFVAVIHKKRVSHSNKMLEISVSDR